METGRKRTLMQIAASAPPELRRKLAHLALHDTIRAREISCIDNLRMASILTLIDSDNPVVKKAAMNILDEIGIRGSPRSLEAAASLSDNAIDCLSELATVGHVVVGGFKKLVGATAIMLALTSKDKDSREEGMLLMRDMETDYLSRTFKTLIQIGALGLDDMDRFISLQLELARIGATERHLDRPSPQAPPAQSAQEGEGEAGPAREQEAVQDDGIGQGREAADESPEECLEQPPPADGMPSCPECFRRDSDVDLLAFAQEIIEDEDAQDLSALDEELVEALRERGLIAQLTFTTPERKPSRPPRELLPDGLSAEEMREATLKRRLISDSQMYRLICLECFRLATAKPLIDKGYAPTDKLKSNLHKRLNNDRKLQLQFEKCWKRMVCSGAIVLRKCASTASLNPHVQDITDPDVVSAVDWAFSEHRRITAPSP